MKCIASLSKRWVIYHLLCVFTYLYAGSHPVGSKLFLQSVGCYFSVGTNKYKTVVWWCCKRFKNPFLLLISKTTFLTPSFSPCCLWLNAVSAYCPNTAGLVIPNDACWIPMYSKGSLEFQKGVLMCAAQGVDAKFNWFKVIMDMQGNCYANGR